jgi:hypothetical protein
MGEDGQGLAVTQFFLKTGQILLSFGIISQKQDRYL